MVYLSKKWLVLAFILSIGGASFIKPAEQSYTKSSKSLTEEQRKTALKDKIRFFNLFLWGYSPDPVNPHIIESFVETYGVSPNATPEYENFPRITRFTAPIIKLPIIFWVLALNPRIVREEDRLPMLRYLLSKGAKVNFTQPVHTEDLPRNLIQGIVKGDTLLHLAARLNNVEIFKELLAACVDPEVKNSEGQTAWDIATQMGNGGILFLRPRTGVIAQACTLARSAGSALGAIWGSASSGFIG